MVEHDGEIASPDDAPPAKVKAPSARDLRRALQDYLAGRLDRAALERIAA